MQIDDRRTPAEILATGPELRIPTAAAQTRIVSVARIRMDSRKSVRLFSGIICDDISEIAVGTLITECGFRRLRTPVPIESGQ